MRQLLLFLVLIAVVLGIAVVKVALTPAPIETEDPQRITIKLPEGYSYGGGNFGRHLDVSPDGKKIVFVGRERSKNYGNITPPKERRLYLQTIGEPAPLVIAGTDGANDPAFSPDGRYVVFYSEESLKKVSLDGSGVSVIGKASPPRGIAWLDAETLILGNTEGPLLRMTMTKGEASPLLPSKVSSLAHLSPHVLPGNKAVLFTIANGPLFNARIWKVDLATGEEQQLIDENGFAPRYLSTGHIVFASSPRRKLKAARFDLATLAIVGSPVPVLESPLFGQGSGGSTDYAVSKTGVLVYTPRREYEIDDVLAELVDTDFTEIHVQLNWFELLAAIGRDGS